MSFVLSLIALISAAGGLAVLYLLRSAPEGYEDETGFHFSKQDEASGSHSPLLIPVKSVQRPVHF